MYRFSTSWEGWVRAFVSSPSFVIRSNPSEFASRRPTGYTRTPQPAVSSATVFRPFSSRRVQTKPRGLFSMMYTRLSCRTGGRPSRRISSRSGSALLPKTAGTPFTVTLPARISSSASLREAVPQADRSFCSRSSIRVSFAPVSSAAQAEGHIRSGRRSTSTGAAFPKSSGAALHPAPTLPR